MNDYCNIKPQKLINLSYGKNDTLLDEGIFYGNRWTCHRVIGNPEFLEFTYYIAELKFVRYSLTEEKVEFNIGGHAYREMKNFMEKTISHTPNIT